MVLFTVIKIVVISLLLIYAGHVLWGYYTMDPKPSQKANDGRSSALRDSKRMYEDMARVIQLGEHRTSNLEPSRSPEPKFASTSLIGDLPTTMENEEPCKPIKIVNIPSLENDGMQQELKEFMEKMT